jgi:hypothetical protein
MISQDTYEEKKKYFELFFTMVEKPRPHIVRGDTEYNERGEKITFTELTVQDVKNLLRNVFCDEAPFASLWLKDPQAKSVHRVGTHPYNGTYDESKRFIQRHEETILNVFQGFSPLIRVPFTEDLLAPWFALTRALCEGDNTDSALRERCFIFHRNVLAKKIQDPTSKLGFLIIFEGKSRVGKNVHMEPVGKIFADQYLQTCKLDDIVGQHSTLWVNRLLVVINECEVTKKNRHADGVLKSHITDVEQTVNPKGREMYQIDDHAQYYVFTNKANPVPMDVNSGDGRIVSFKCGERFRSRPAAWWRGMTDHFKRPDFIAALYNHLNSEDLSGYDFKLERENILTDSYRRLVEANIPFVARALVHYLKKRLRDDVLDVRVRRSTVCDEYIAFAKEMKQTSLSRQAYYNKLRELKLNITDVKVENCDGFALHTEDLYQECLDRGYENETFAIRKRRKVEVETRGFDLSEF